MSTTLTPNRSEILSRINSMKTLCPEGKKEVTALVEAIIGEKLDSPKLDPKKTYFFIHRQGKDSACAVLPAGADTAFAFCPNELTSLGSNWDRKSAEEFVARGAWRITAAFGGVL